MKKAGYFLFDDPNTRKQSYVLKLTAGYYPRFHVYVKESTEGGEPVYVIDLHIDQKKPSYGKGAARGGTNMHSGEYDGPVVEREIDRLRRWAIAMGATFPSDGITTAEVREDSRTNGDATAHESSNDDQEVADQPERKLFGGLF